MQAISDYPAQDKWFHSWNSNVCCIVKSVQGRVVTSLCGRETEPGMFGYLKWKKQPRKRNRCRKCVAIEQEGASDDD